MKLFKSLSVLLVSILLAACGPMEQAGDGTVVVGDLASPEITAESSADDKVTSALSAAPAVDW